MPLVYQQNINAHTRLGVWKIEEPEAFFLKRVPVQSSVTHPNKILQHLAGRYLLTELFPDFPYNLIRIADTRKPFLENESYHFSISHCGEYAAVMVSKENRVGVDVERITSKVARVKHKFLTPEEQGLVEMNTDGTADLPDSKPLTAAWSIKEALFKWQGTGEVDFKKHLVISGLEIEEHSGRASCTVLRTTPTNLLVNLLFINSHCISWVMSETG